MLVEANRAYSTDEVCRRYSVAASTVRKLVEDGKLRAGKAGRNLRFSPTECDRVFLGIEKDKVA